MFPVAFAADAEVIVSELTSNAIRFSETIVIVEIHLCGSGVLIEVYDSGDDVPVLKEPDFEASTGRGLNIVAALADRWGYEIDRSGIKCVWAALMNPK